MTSLGPGGQASDLRRAQRAIDTLRAEVRRLKEQLEALQKRLEKLEK